MWSKILAIGIYLIYIGCVSCIDHSNQYPETDEDSAWCKFVYKSTDCADPSVQKDCPNLCTIDEDSALCKFVDKSTDCEDPSVQKDCPNLCTIDEDSALCKFVDASNDCEDPSVKKDCPNLCRIDVTGRSPAPSSSSGSTPTSLGLASSNIPRDELVTSPHPHHTAICSPSCTIGICLRTNTCGCSPTKTSDQCQNEFFWAAYGSELEYVWHGLSSNMNPDWLNHQGLTSLMAATQAGHVSMVQALVDGGADLELREPIIGTTALYDAAVRNHAAVVRVLLRAGANVNVKAEDGATPLMGAAQCGHISAVQALVGGGADLEQTQPSTGAPVLYVAAAYNQSAVARALLRAGANVNVRAKDGATPLTKAAREGYVAVVEALLDAQAAVDLVHPEYNWTALHYAARYNQPSIARLLLGKGADKTKQTKGGYTPGATARNFNNDEVARIIENY